MNQKFVDNMGQNANEYKGPVMIQDISSIIVGKKDSPMRTATRMVDLKYPKPQSPTRNVLKKTETSTYLTCKLEFPFSKGVRLER
jgi:hypothetical protein